MVARSSFKVGAAALLAALLLASCTDTNSGDGGESAMATGDEMNHSVLGRRSSEPLGLDRGVQRG